MAKSKGRTSSGTTSSSTTTTHSPSSNHTSSGKQTAAPDKNYVGSGVGSGMGGKKTAAGAAAVAVTGAAYALDAGAVGDMAKWFGHALGDLGGDFFGGAMDGAGLGGTMHTVLFVAGGVVILYVVMR